mgnify:FL=1
MDSSKIVSRPQTKAYDDGFDKIFRKRSLTFLTSKVKKDAKDSGKGSTVLPQQPKSTS